MDRQAHSGRPSSSASGHENNHRPAHINQSSFSPSLNGLGGPDDSSSVGLGLDMDVSSPQQQQEQQHQNLTFGGHTDSPFDNFASSSDFLNSSQPVPQQAFGQATGSETTVFDPSASFGQQPTNSTSNDPLAFDNQTQAAFLSPNLNDGDFSLFPPVNQSDHFNTPLFEASNLNPTDMNSMASPHSHHTPTPPNLLQPDGLRPGSAHQSPSFGQHQQFSSPHSSHSRNASLGPEAALLPGQIADWTQAQFQGHRRSPSEYSDVSSVSPSPNLVSADSFDEHAGHSPLQQASDTSLYSDVLNIDSFTISDPSQRGRSPSHSPAISPRIMPQQMPDMRHSSFGLAPPNANFSGVMGYHGLQTADDSFGQSLAAQDRSDIPYMAPPSINIDFAPNNAKQGSYEPTKAHIDQDSLTPPSERGR